MPSFPEQISKLIQSIPPRQRALIVAVVVASGVGIQQFVQWQKERGFKPIYSGLGAEDAGQVVQKLKESGVEYRLGEGGASILVPEGRVAELRLEMAGAGLPRSGRIGFELFDKTTFGATDFAEQVNFRRAVEGELERSVMAINEVEQARVHVTFPKDSIFTESRQPAKASVLLKLRTGSNLTPQSVIAITHLVSSAVEGLTPDQVSVLDMRGKLLSKPRRPGAAAGQEASEEALEHQQKIERDILQKIHNTLSPLLGEDKYRASISVECDINSGEQSEENYDPTKSVMLTSQTSVDSVSSTPTGGQPGSASNLPTGAATIVRPASATTRKTENISFQTSRTVRRLTLPQGAIKSLSISLLVDQTVKWDKTPAGIQKTFIPPAPETLKIIRDLVAGVSGLKKERGDQLIVESLPFESTVNAAPPENVNGVNGPATPVLTGKQELEKALRDPKVWAAGGILAVLLTSAFVFVRMRKRRAARLAASLPALAAATQDRVISIEAGDASEGSGALGAGTSHLLSAGAEESQKLVDTIREEVKTNPALFAGVIQDWLVESGVK